VVATARNEIQNGQFHFIVSSCLRANISSSPTGNFIARSKVNSSSFTADARTQHATFSHSRQMMFYVSPSKFVLSAAADTKNLQIEMWLSTQCICDVRSL
jgi:hypothetical protein